jgi:hypothetical protein
MVKRIKFLIALLPVFLLLWTVSCEGLQGQGLAGDSDGDGWSDVQERTARTNPNNVDSDGDGYWDPHDPNPLDPNIPTVGGAPKHEPSPAPPPPAPTTSPTEIPAVAPQETAALEFHEVQDAVWTMMRNNNLTELANPVTVPTNNMHLFPDATTRHGAKGVGYVLSCHDFNGDGTADTNYILFNRTRGTYICDKHGNVTQVTTGYE